MLPTAYSTPLLVAALLAFAWALAVHLIEASSLGAKIPETLRPKLAMIGGLLLGVVQGIVQGQDWRLAAVAGLITGAVGMGGVSNPSRSSPPG